MSSFFINHHDDWRDGPNIFSNRLKIELESQGHTFDLNSKNRMSIIAGDYKESCFNILRLDGLYLDSGNFLGDSNYLNAPIFDCYEKFDHIIFQSNFSKECYEAFTGIKKSNTVIYNGVSSDFFKKADPISKPDGFEKVVIASSKWRRHKRLEECIEAFKNKKLKDVALVVLGGYKNVDMPNVFTLPMIHPTELPKYYQMADAMVHLSWLDWCPNTVVEALASRLPVLCTHNGGTKELVKNDGVIIKLEEDYKVGEMVDLYNPPKVNTEIIVNGILKLLEKPKIQKRKDLDIKNTGLEYSKLLK